MCWSMKATHESESWGSMKLLLLFAGAGESSGQRDNVNVPMLAFQLFTPVEPVMSNSSLTTLPPLTTVMNKSDSSDQIKISQFGLMKIRYNIRML